MTLGEIKKAVESGEHVYHHNVAYEVIKDSIGQWLIYCHLNGFCIGLTWMDGVTMNGKPEEFFVKRTQAQPSTEEPAKENVA